MELCNVKGCTGCGACLNACPRDCISMKRDAHGFDFPEIDESRCIKCRMCQRACPQLYPLPQKDNPRLIYAGQLRDEDVALTKSSSGGIAYALSKYTIRRGGVVFGAAYDSSMNVKHISVEQMSDLVRLQGSKYVQSDIGTTYRQVKETLDNGRCVLFVGAGCQVAGLYRYLGNRSYPGLLTCDLLCGGGTSPGLFAHYIQYLKTIHKTEIRDYAFRDKQYGGGGYMCSLISLTGNRRYLRGSEAGYVRTMGAGYIRESCFECRYANMHRVGDISLGDFWNVTERLKEYKKGISLVLVNSEKGKYVLEQLNKTLWLEQYTVDDALASQGCALKSGKKRPKDYDAFWEEAFEKSWPSVYQKYLRAASWKMELADTIPVQLALFLQRVKRSIKKHGK